MGWSDRHSLVLEAHVTQAATPQEAKPPSALGQLPFMTTIREATPLPCPVRKPGLREVKSLASGRRARTGGPVSEL